MALENLTQSLGSLPSALTFAEGWSIIQPLLLFIIGMVIYSIFVFKFYRFIARRDVFRISEGGKTSFLARVGYALEYVFLFPLVAFFWFFVIATLLSMLSTVIEINNIFMLSMAILATIRVTAYYDEDLSKDIAKLIPFALLAILLIDITDISTAAPFEVLAQFPAVLKNLFYYFIFIVVLEFFLRVIFHRKHKKPEIEEKKAPTDSD